MTLSNETIELIEKKADLFYATDKSNATYNKMESNYIQGAIAALTDPAILASVKGEEWVRVEDGFPDEDQNILCYQNGIFEPLVSTFKGGKFCRYDNWTEGDKLMSYTYPDVILWKPLINPPTSPKTK